MLSQVLLCHVVCVHWLQELNNEVYNIFDRTCGQVLCTIYSIVKLKTNLDITPEDGNVNTPKTCRGLAFNVILVCF